MRPDLVVVSAVQTLTLFEAHLTRTAMRNLRAKMRHARYALRHLLAGSTCPRFVACADQSDDSRVRPFLLEV